MIKYTLSAVAVLTVAVVALSYTVSGRAIETAELTCSSPIIISTSQRVVAGMSWPFGGDHVQVLKTFNYRPNPDLGSEASGLFAALTDTKRPCKVNLMTDRGEFGFTYGWKTIDGQLFVTGQLGDPETGE